MHNIYIILSKVPKTSLGGLLQTVIVRTKMTPQRNFDWNLSDGSFSALGNRIELISFEFSQVFWETSLEYPEDTELSNHFI